jgi:hypothetical protein
VSRPLKTSPALSATTQSSGLFYEGHASMVMVNFDLGCQHSALVRQMLVLGYLLAVPALVAPSQPAPGRAAATGGSSFWSDAWTNAALHGSTWRLKLDVGREEGTQAVQKTRPVWPWWSAEAEGRSGPDLALGGACWSASWPKPSGGCYPHRHADAKGVEHYLNPTPTPTPTPNQARRCRRSGARRARACRCRWRCASPATRSRAATCAGPSIR